MVLAHPVPNLPAKLLLALNIIVIIDSQSHESHYHILQSDSHGSLQTTSPHTIKSQSSKLLLAITSSVILHSKSCRIHDHI
jgi:hypothetical protein